MVRSRKILVLMMIMTILRNILVCCMATLLLMPLCAAQQAATPALQGSVVDGMGLPGESWTTVGNLSPVEHGNGYVQSYVEQDAAVLASRSGSLSLTPYVSVGLVLDTKGYDWNNKVEPQAGIKLNKSLTHGLVSAGTAYTYEDRFNSLKSSGMVLYVQDWFGWQSVAERANRFPGSTWAAFGNISPVEHGNWIGQAFVSQGVVARRFGKTALVPYVQATFSRDTKGFDWDNKAVYGSGLKFAFTHEPTYTEFGVGYLRENRFYSGQSAGTLSIFINFWCGWNLLGRKAGM
ncbi:MAG TPA: hypothetical protein VJP04_12210 [Terriglobales bacterium]|nr:hypothetical protein [Terriglobales bacterium]